MSERRATTAAPGQVPERAEALTRVALDLFSHQGFSAVTIKDIARAAGINTAMIYYYFENKDDLFRATIEYAARRALDSYRELRERHSDPVSLIDDWFDNNLLLAEPIQKLVKIMLDYSGGNGRLESVDAVIRDFYAEECGILQRGIRDGVKAGIFRPVDAERLAAFASVHLDGIMTASAIREGFDVGAAIASLKEHFWYYLDGSGGGRSTRTGAKATN